VDNAIQGDPGLRAAKAAGVLDGIGGRTTHQWLQASLDATARTPRIDALE
jgi:hypothetical protein